MGDLTVSTAANVAPAPRKPAADLQVFSLGLPVEQMQAMLTEYNERRKCFRDWLRDQLVEGIHYGYPPGCEPKTNSDGDFLVWQKGGYVVVPKEQWTPKPSFYKAGADFLCDVFGVIDTYEADEAGWRQLGAKDGTFVYTCRLVSRSTGEIVGEGRGARRVGQKGGDENNSLKMAKKSAKVDAVLNAWALADLFTQDLEDLGQAAHENPAASDDAPTAKPREDRVGKDEIGRLLEIWKSQRHPREAIPANWQAWVVDTTGRGFEVGKASQWTREDLAAVSRALEKEATGD